MNEDESRKAIPIPPLGNNGIVVGSATQRETPDAFMALFLRGGRLCASGEHRVGDTVTPSR